MHYYLTGWTPLSVGEHDLIFTTGGHFFPAPGKYVLPFNEGAYHIGNGKIFMTTRGSGQVYEHDLCRLVLPEFAVDYGWYS